MKVTFVGAGSIEFTRNVVTDLCSYPEFAGQLQLSLYDISAERLAFAERLTWRACAQTFLEHVTEGARTWREKRTRKERLKALFSNARQRRQSVAR